MFHGMDDIQKDCPACNSSKIKKMLTTPIHLKNKKDESVGNLTKKYIEDNKEILKDLKEEAQKEYDRT
jgi:hypothetical protein